MLVQGIRPVLPLIRNTPYGKRIQNKLQREHADNFGGAFQGLQAVMNIGINNQAIGLGPGHLNPATRIPSNNPMADIYASQPGLYGIQGQGSYGPGPIAQMHGLGTRSIDEYVLQSHSAHNMRLAPPHTHAGGYSGISGYANVSPFGNVGLAGLNDPYQNYGYGM